MTNPRKPPPERSDTLANLIGGAVADIREKLVEEAWFGRSLNGPSSASQFYETMWKLHDRTPDRQGLEKDNGPEMDR